MPLSDKQVSNVCLYGAGGRQCRYLAQDPKNYKLFNCAKKVSGIKSKVDKVINKHIKDQLAKGNDPANGWQPCSDGGSCQGYLYLPTVRQGYDV